MTHTLIKFHNKTRRVKRAFVQLLQNQLNIVYFTSHSVRRESFCLFTVLFYETRSVNLFLPRRPYKNNKLKPLKLEIFLFKIFKKLFIKDNCKSASLYQELTRTNLFHFVFVKFLGQTFRIRYHIGSRERYLKSFYINIHS